MAGARRLPTAVSPLARLLLLALAATAAAAVSSFSTRTHALRLSGLKLHATQSPVPWNVGLQGEAETMSTENRWRDLKSYWDTLKDDMNDVTQHTTINMNALKEGRYWSLPPKVDDNPKVVDIAQANPACQPVILLLESMGGGRGSGRASVKTGPTENALRENAPATNGWIVAVFNSNQMRSIKGFDLEAGEDEREQQQKQLDTQYEQQKKTNTQAAPPQPAENSVKKEMLEYLQQVGTGDFVAIAVSGSASNGFDDQIKKLFDSFKCTNSQPSSNFSYVCIGRKGFSSSDELYEDRKQSALATVKKTLPCL